MKRSIVKVGKKATPTLCDEGQHHLLRWFGFLLGLLCDQTLCLPGPLLRMSKEEDAPFDRALLVWTLRNHTLHNRISQTITPTPKRIDCTTQSPLSASNIAWLFETSPETIRSILSRKARHESFCGDMAKEAYRLMGEK